MRNRDLQRFLRVLLLLCCSCAYAQVDVTATVAFGASGKKSKKLDASNVVLWLTPLAGFARPLPSAAPLHPRLLQKNKSFAPHVLVVPVGTQVEFPNHDPFFHNVFSLFEGKRFDLGLYEAGSTRDVLFDKPGISYIFCNIHAEMSAVVIALSTPYYGISDRAGHVTLPGIPPGRYALHIWYETALPETLNALSREVVVGSDPPALGVLHLPAPGIVPPHKNLYGHDYPPPTPDQPVYAKP
jgi:plastocyanin